MCKCVFLNTNNNTFTYVLFCVTKERCFFYLIKFFSVSLFLLLQLMMMMMMMILIGV